MGMGCGGRAAAVSRCWAPAAGTRAHAARSAVRGARERGRKWVGMLEVQFGAEIISRNRWRAMATESAPPACASGEGIFTMGQTLAKGVSGVSLRAAGRPRVLRGCGCTEVHAPAAHSMSSGYRDGPREATLPPSFAARRRLPAILPAPVL